MSIIFHCDRCDSKKLRTNETLTDKDKEALAKAYTVEGK